METIQPRCVKCGQTMEIVQLRCEGCDLTLDGSFELPLLAKLTLSEQAFVAAFIRVHGHIKKMESLFGISYPTVKNRLNEISRKLDLSFQAGDDAGDILERLERGEITVEQALELLS